MTCPNLPDDIIPYISGSNLFFYMDAADTGVNSVEILSPNHQQSVIKATSQQVTPEMVEEIIRRYYYRTPAVSNDSELILAWTGSQNREQTKRKYYSFGQKLLRWVLSEGIPDLRLVQQPKLLDFINSWGEVSPYTKSNHILMLRSLWSYGSGESIGYFYGILQVRFLTRISAIYLKPTDILKTGKWQSWLRLLRI